MKKPRFVTSLVLPAVMACGLVSPAYAQQAGPKPLEPAPQSFKLTVVLSRVNGEKRVANLPFVMIVTTGDRASVQMSSQVPLPTVTEGGKSSFTYQNVGTNMTAGVSVREGGLYLVNLTVNDSQVLSDNNGNGAGATGRTQSFTVQAPLVLKDGGSIQFNAATDKTTGDVVKVDVTLNVIK
ncbi:MAG TPA: hypothetical protein VFV78_01260 [Vicinamibacterales bacterium]|nr:hypothetical protein [Vicinamibacterales bacterium]